MVQGGGGFHPFEPTPAHIIYTGLGFFIVIFGLFSLFIKERLYLGEAPIAAVFGVIVGPVAINVFDPSRWGGSNTAAPGNNTTNEITLEFLRVTIALSVFAVGVELPKKYLLRHWRSIAMLLGPVMIIGWMVTAGLIHAFIPKLDFLNSLVVAAAVTPTDPILAQAVIGGPWAEKHVPAHVRHMLMCESGCNDGAAFPFLYLALFLTLERGNARKAIAEWFYDAIAYEIILGTFLGALIGWAARKVMRFSERHKLIDRESFVAQYVSLAIASMGVNVLLGSDDLLAAFASGTAFAWDGWFTRQTEDSNFSNIVDLLFNIASFVYIGSLIPFSSFSDAAIGLEVWRLVVLAILVLLLKRIPAVIALWKLIPDVKTFREAIFAAHFGPMGVGAIFIATLARTKLPEEVPQPPVTSNDYLALTVQPIIYFIVMCSILVHGLTLPFFAFSRRAHTLTRTLSRHASMSLSTEPAWLARVRRFKTDDEDVDSELRMEEGNMSEIQRVLNAQLGVIGRGAIGGEAERELRGEEEGTNDEDAAASGAGKATKLGGEGSSPSESSTVATTTAGMGVTGLVNVRTALDVAEADEEAELERARRRERLRCEGEDAFVDGGGEGEDGEGGDYLADPSCDWCGEDTVEAKRYRERQAEKARRRAEAQQHGEIAPEVERGDVEGTARGAKLEPEAEGAAVCGDHTQYPLVRSWVEGHTLVIETTQRKSADPEVHCMRLSDEDRERILDAPSPAHAWVQAHREGIERHLGLTEHHGWGPLEAPLQMLKHNIPKLYTEFLERGGGGEGSGRRGGAGAGRRRSSVAGAATTSADDSKAKELRREDTQDERDERTDLLYGAPAWERNAREEEEEEETEEQRWRNVTVRRPRGLGRRGLVQAASPSSRSPPSPAERGGRSRGGGAAGGTSPRRTGSTSPTGGAIGAAESAPTPPRVQLAVHAARPAMPGRRTSMRRRLLAGKLGLTGRRSDHRARDGELEEEADEEEATSGAEARASTSTSIRRVTPTPDSPTTSPLPRTAGDVRAREKFFPRPASMGGLGADPNMRPSRSLLRPMTASESERLGSVQWLDPADTSHERASRGGGAKQRDGGNGGGASSEERAGSKSSEGAGGNGGSVEGGGGGVFGGGISSLSSPMASWLGQRSGRPGSRPSSRPTSRAPSPVRTRETGDTPTAVATGGEGQQTDQTAGGASSTTPEVTETTSTPTATTTTTTTRWRGAPFERTDSLGSRVAATARTRIAGLFSGAFGQQQQQQQRQDQSHSRPPSPTRTSVGGPTSTDRDGGTDEVGVDAGDEGQTHGGAPTARDS